jgi:hypothetical protein
MRGSHVSRAQHRPLRIEPDFGQVPENSVGTSSNKETWNVLKERETGSY